MPAYERNRANRLFTTRSVIYLGPQNIIHDDGFKFFSSPYVVETKHNDIFYKHLRLLYDEVRANVMQGIKGLKVSCEELGRTGPYLSAQINLTTSSNDEYITLAISYALPGSDELTHVGLATRKFPGCHTADDIFRWMDEVRRSSSAVVAASDFQHHNVIPVPLAYVVLHVALSEFGIYFELHILIF